MSEATATEIAVTDGNAVAPVSESATVLSLISHAASDPNVDMDKMERLMTMRQKMVDDEARKEYTVAMSEAQAEMRPVSADAHNPQTRSKYATYAALDNALRPIYTKHGFYLSFGTFKAEAENCIGIECDVSHNGGHTKTVRIEMPADGKGAKGGDVMTKTHAVGSASSYGQRYLLKMIFNVAVGEADDDGRAASGPMVLNSSQAKLFINHELVVKTIREMPTFKRLQNLRNFIESITFVHPSTIGIWLEECDARAEAMNAEQEARAKQDMTGKPSGPTQAEALAKFDDIVWEFGQQADGVTDEAEFEEMKSDYESRMEGASTGQWDEFNAIVDNVHKVFGVS